MKFARKVDSNQKEIIKSLRQVYAKVFDLSGIGQGIPDLMVIYRNQIYLLEVKSGQNGLTKAQEAFFMEAHGCDKVGVVKSPDDALRFIGAISW